jgi:hypothetical protein
MVPLYAARVSDLEPGDFVEVKCACGHQKLIAALTQSLRLAPDDRILSLEGGCSARSAMRGGRRW